MTRLRIGEFDFDWDPTKDATNQSKHGIGFEQAATIWTCPELILDIADTRFAYSEERWIALGPLPEDAHCIIAVAYCERHDVVRIISARSAEKSEKRAYFQRMQGENP